MKSLILIITFFPNIQQIFIHFNISVGIFTAMGCSTVLSNLFLCCYLGKMASNSYAQMAECLYDCNWYEIPLDLQKYFIIMVANSQVPPTYSGYGVAELNLSTFRKVGFKWNSVVHSLLSSNDSLQFFNIQILRTVHSYYMMFKAISSIQWNRSQRTTHWWWFTPENIWTCIFSPLIFLINNKQTFNVHYCGCSFPISNFHWMYVHNKYSLCHRVSDLCVCAQRKMR